MFYGIRDLLLHPDAFFERVSQEKVSLVPPLAIVGAGSFLFAIAHLLFWAFPTRGGWSVPDLTPGGFVQQMILSLMIASIILPFIVWGLFSFVIHIISRMSGGTGSLPATVRIVGYGMVPWTVSAIIPFLVNLHRFFTYAGGPVTGGYSGIWFMPPVFCSLPILGILIWSCCLWTLGVRHVHRLPLRNAAVVTIVPVVVFLSLSLPVQWYIGMMGGLLTGG